MRTLCYTLVLIASTPLLGAGQAAPSAKPPVRTPVAVPAARPTAIIHTTAGDMRCQLFEKEAPIGVANFIGLSNGTKDWTNPVSHAKKHGVPLYDGTIFHRVIDVRPSRTPCLRELRSGYQWLTVFHHGGPVSQPEWRIHDFRPMRSGSGRVGQADRADGNRW